MCYKLYSVVLRPKKCRFLSLEMLSLLHYREGGEEEDETAVSIINQIPFPLGKPCGSTALCSSCRCADTTEAIFRPHFKTTVETVSLADPTIKMFIVFFSL